MTERTDKEVPMPEDAKAVERELELELGVRRGSNSDVQEDGPTIIEYEAVWDKLVSTELARRESEAKLEQTVAALTAYVLWHGGCHESACPQDDTCHCEGKPINDAVNEALRGVK